MDTDKDYYLAFSVFPGIGPVRFKLLVEYFGSARDAWLSNRKDLISIGLSVKLTDKLLDFRKGFDIQKYKEKLKNLHIGTVTVTDPRYPKLLKEIQDPPFVLYVRGKKGNSRLSLDRTIAVVGTRKITDYGICVTEKIVSSLTGYGFTIISGMAYGVDAHAHRTALANGGKTIAVLGCGVDIIAPMANKQIYDDIRTGGNGAIVSEMPLSLRPDKGLFPSRNRIISGLSMGVLVVEGADDSGALITARYASEQGRDVFAIPGPITSPYSRASAKLIKNGAKLVESASDILEELGLDTRPSNKRNLEDLLINTSCSLEKNIITNLFENNLSIDQLVRLTGKKVSDISPALTVLELRRVVKKSGDGQYVLA